MRVDLHVHTCYSGDSLTSLSETIRWAQRRSLDALAITDHNTIAGALALARIAPFAVIVGEEILTTRGEIIGLFLHRQIPSGLSPRETAHRIHAQGGIVYLPHPMDRVRHSALAPDSLLGISEVIDAIEVLNARVTFRADNRQAALFARSHGILAGAGSDSHQGYEIGHAYVEMPPFRDPRSFLKSLAEGQIRGHISSPLVHLASSYAKLAKGLAARQ